MLTLNELRRMVKKHNVLMSIIIPPKTNRDALIKLIEKNGYSIDHDKKKIVPKIQMKRKPTVPLPPAPPKKTEEEKKLAKAKKMERDSKRDKVGYDNELKKRVEAVKKARASKPPMKKENEVRPKQNVGRPRVNPNKIKVISKPKPVKKKSPAKKTSTPPVKPGSKGVKVWTGSGTLPDGTTTKNNVLYESRWRPLGYKIANLKPGNKKAEPKKGGDTMEITASVPTTIPGKSGQYEIDNNRVIGKKNITQINQYLKSKGFGDLSGTALSFFNKIVGKKGWGAHIKIRLEGGQTMKRKKTLQPPFKEGVIDFTLREKGKQTEGSMFNLKYIK